jgi:hypothetical protein
MGGNYPLGPIEHEGITIGSETQRASAVAPRAHPTMHHVTGRYPKSALASIQKECGTVSRDRTAVRRSPDNPIKRCTKRANQFKLGRAKAGSHDGNRFFSGELGRYFIGIFVNGRHGGARLEKLTQYISAVASSLP